MQECASYACLLHAVGLEPFLSPVSDMLELLDLEAGAAGNGGLTSVAIVGMGGMGKSTLGRAIYRAARVRFFSAGGRSSWAELSLEPSDLDITTALRRLLARLGVACDETMQHAELRQLLGEQPHPLLLLLDNVKATSVLDKLLPQHAGQWNLPPGYVACRMLTV